MPTRNLNQSLLTPTSIERSLGMPAGGPKMLPITLDFQNFDTQELDLQNVQARGFLDMVQTVWVDNVPSPAETTITVNKGGQVLRVPAGQQGYLPILCPNPVQLEFDGNGGATQVQAILINFPIQAELWSPAGGVSNLPAFSTRSQDYGPQTSTDAFLPLVGAGYDAFGYATAVVTIFNQGPNAVDVNAFRYNRVDRADRFNSDSFTVGSGGQLSLPGGLGQLMTTTRFVDFEIASDLTGLPGTVIGSVYLML